MSRKSPEISVIENFENKKIYLSKIQAESLIGISSEINRTIFILLKTGILTNRNGRIIPNYKNPKKENKHA